MGISPNGSTLICRDNNLYQFHEYDLSNGTNPRLISSLTFTEGIAVNMLTYFSFGIYVSVDVSTTTSAVYQMTRAEVCAELPSDSTALPSSVIIQDLALQGDSPDLGPAIGGAVGTISRSTIC